MKRLARFLKRFFGNARGVAAVEFAFIAPVMVTMLTGLIELSYLMMAERRVSGAAHSTADLLAQETDVTSTDLNDIFSAAALIMAPFSTGSLTIGAWIKSTDFPRDDAVIVSNRFKVGFQLDTTVDKGPRTIGFN